MFLINEAFVMHHKTIEEHPSHSSELCHKVNYEVTFLDSRQGDQVSKPYLTIILQKQLGGR